MTFVNVKCLISEFEFDEVKVKAQKSEGKKM